MKPKLVLVLRSAEISSVSSWYAESLWKEYFDIEVYDSSKTYDTSTLFVVWYPEVDNPEVIKLQQQGHKIVADKLWELDVLDQQASDIYWLTNKNWFRYNEALWWHSLGYHNYSPAKQLQYTAFMPIRRPSTERSFVVNKLTPVLDKCIWSYRSKTLPNDIAPTDNLYQRYFNPEWYNKTWCSIVVETAFDAVDFVTEKTFKPIAFQHPFLIVGAPGILDHVRELGFATFDNVFDESYDQILSLDTRLDVIINNLENIQLTEYDKETQRRLEHNHNHFFDLTVVRQGIIKEIIEPLLHYAET